MHHATTSGQMIEDSLCPTLSSYVQNYDFKQQNCMKEALEGKKKGVAKKPSFYHSSSVVKQKKTTEGRTKKRDNDLHRLPFMPNGLLDGAELAYYSKGQISPSQFEAHAGWSARCQPYRNIYTSSGLTLHDIALSLANGQNLATGSSDDMCATCGAGEDLIICDGCPRAFHAVGAEMIPASVSYAIHRKHVEKGFTDGVSNDECFDPIVATSSRDLIPVMVCGRNISGQEFGGMYCVVLIVKSVVLAGLLRIFGREVAELPLVATSRENQGESLLYSLNVENLVLPAAEEAESIWTKKLGFRKMIYERLLKYTRNRQLTFFKGTSMLEKKV
ncbi:hypothetical protein ACSBR1_003078 [Camellia fascicularis]